LHAATAGKHSEVALLLLENGAKSDATDAGNYTALQIATQNNLTAVVDAIAGKPG
jgi:ankyrin repeat protein